MRKIKKIFEHPIVYKIIADLLILTLIVTIGALTAETIVPGIIGVYISQLTIFALLFLLIFLISLVSHTQNISTPIKKNKKGFFIISIFIFTSFIAIASFRYGLILGTPIIILTIIIYFLLFKSLQETIDRD